MSELSPLFSLSPGVVVVLHCSQCIEWQRSLATGSATINGSDGLTLPFLSGWVFLLNITSSSFVILQPCNPPRWTMNSDEGFFPSCGRVKERGRGRYAYIVNSERGLLFTISVHICIVRSIIRPNCPSKWGAHQCCLPSHHKTVGKMHKLIYPVAIEIRWWITKWKYNARTESRSNMQDFLLRAMEIKSFEEYLYFITDGKNYSFENNNWTEQELIFLEYRFFGKHCIF